MKRQCGQPSSASGAKHAVLGVKKGRSLRISARDPQQETRAARSFHLAVRACGTVVPLRRLLPESRHLAWHAAEEQDSGRVPSNLLSQSGALAHARATELNRRPVR